MTDMLLAAEARVIANTVFFVEAQIALGLGYINKISVFLQNVTIPDTEPETCEYGAMSPEQLAGKKVDGRSGLFSLGVMFYRLVAGQLPFTGDSMATLMFKTANEPHANIRTLNPEIPQCLSDVIDRMLEKDMEKRYVRGAEIAADIRRCLGQAG